MLTIDADSQRVIVGPGATQEITILKLKRRLVASLLVQFTRGTSVIELPNDAVGKIEFKLPFEFDSEPITGASNWTKFGGGSSTYYVFLFALINAPLDTLFGYDAAFTFTNTGNLINATAHGMSIGDRLQGFSTVTLPNPLKFGTDYYIIASGFTANAFKVSTMPGGTEVTLTNVGTGTHSFVRVSNDVTLVHLNADIYWIHTSGTIEGKTQTLDAQIENDVTRSGDTIPGSPAIVYSHDSFWREGSGVPSNGLGLDGDFYINTQVGSGYFDVYERSGGVYSLIGNIKGGQGTSGTDGLDGSQGPRGFQGFQGTSGAQGNQGTQGTQGNQGTPGTSGIDGLDGTQGPQGPSGGAQGAQGAQGTQGNQGNQGSQGVPGNDGMDGLGSQGPQGFQGTTGGGGGGVSYILIEDQKSNGTNGGNSPGINTWNKRDVNTEVADTGGNASISSNQIILDAGTYRCHISAPAYSLSRNQARLYNVTGSAPLLIGSCEYGSGLIQTRSVIAGRFTLGVQSTLEIQHQSEAAPGGGLDYGVASSFGTDSGTRHETYTQAMFEKE